ncbi:MAG: ATP12 family protein [Pseudomonadota bacterium]
MKRFWAEATVLSEGAGHGVFLDARALRTPAKALLQVPTRGLAEAIAAEWGGVDDTVRPAEMPMTRLANTVVDRVASAGPKVVETVASYGGSDLLCYRAPSPRPLADRQADLWDPLLVWSAETLAAPLWVAEGVMHVAQPDASLKALRTAVDAHDVWALTALHELVTLTGSLVLGLAVSRGRLELAEAWQLSRVEEDWNIAEWGEDAEAAATARQRFAAFEDAARFMSLVRSEPL